MAAAFGSSIVWEVAANATDELPVLGDRRNGVWCDAGTGGVDVVRWYVLRRTSGVAESAVVREEVVCG